MNPRPNTLLAGLLLGAVFALSAPLLPSTADAGDLTPPNLTSLLSSDAVEIQAVPNIWANEPSALSHDAPALYVLVETSPAIVSPLIMDRLPSLIPTRVSKVSIYQNSRHITRLGLVTPAPQNFGFCRFDE